jgi:excisionase family DNA binding protein
LDPNSSKQSGEAGTFVPLIDDEGAARSFGVTPRLIQELWARGDLGGVKVGRNVRFRQADLVDYVNRHWVGPKQ